MLKEKQNPVDIGKETGGNGKELILYNDDVNTFDFVIETLVEVCGHDPVQAEQCTLIAHYKGNCPVKSGVDSELQPLFLEMTDRKLTVSIREI
ncbi:MAG: ATP-dependent Clp protease adaptor ClpS [Bacteroidales bacterium]|nr:ATP-dependent Clp protease adaptor ClpS [Bacteroidales bacterium]